MNNLRFAAIGTAMVLVAGCAADRSPDPTAPAMAAASRDASSSTSSPGFTHMAGKFDAIVDFSTLTLTPDGADCLLQVNGRLVFKGTIKGTAIGTTRARVFASCADVASTPPGTYPDVFRSTLVFDGTIHGEDVHGDLVYTGQSQPGGHIDAQLIFSNGIEGTLDADAQLAVGGSYRGSVVTR